MVLGVGRVSRVVLGGRGGLMSGPGGGEGVLMSGPREKGRVLSIVLGGWRGSCEGF